MRFYQRNDGSVPRSALSNKFVTIARNEPRDAGLPQHGYATEEQVMVKHFAIIAVAAAAIGSALPLTTASAQNIGVGVGPNGVTVGAVGRDRYRDYDRDYYRDRRDRNETVIIKRSRDRDRDYYDGGVERRVIERY
jgi:hypothetical protein